MDTRGEAVQWMKIGVGGWCWCRSGADNAVVQLQENRTSENVFVNMFPFSNLTLPMAGGVN
jgi:hypothetical protein